MGIARDLTRCVTLFVICGMPASGKTTFANKIIKEHDAVLLSEDEWMRDLIDMYDNDKMRGNIARLHRKIASRLFIKGVNVVMDGGYYTKEERDNLKNIAKNSNVNFELHYLKVDFSTLRVRRIERNRNLQPKFQTTEENLKKAKSLFQEPDNNENFMLHENQ
jgi:predicted kinase